MSVEQQFQWPGWHIEQVVVGGDEQGAVKQRSFGEDQGIIHFVVRQVTTLPDLFRDALDDPMTHWHQVHGLEFPFGSKVGKGNPRQTMFFGVGWIVVRDDELIDDGRRNENDWVGQTPPDRL